MAHQKPQAIEELSKSLSENTRLSLNVTVLSILFGGILMLFILGLESDRRVEAAFGENISTTSLILIGIILLIVVIINLSFWHHTYKIGKKYSEELKRENLC